MDHFHTVSFIQVGMLLMVFMCSITFSTGTVVSLDELRELKLELKELETKLETKVTQLEEKVTKLEAKNAQLETKVKEQDSFLTFLLLREKNERMASGSQSASISNNQSAVAINGLPSSCNDLKIIGHTLSGFYSVMGSSMMESVYCDFTKLPSDAGFQKWIGYIDVKSAPVHFYVQRSSSFDRFGTPIPFDLVRVNEGNAMDSTSGKFTAPRPGIYFFSFTGLARFPAPLPYLYLGIGLYLNGGRIGLGYVAEGNIVADQESPLTFQSTLNLKSGDQVWVVIDYFSSGAYLYDNGGYDFYYTHFTGFMLKEEIGVSL